MRSPGIIGSIVILSLLLLFVASTQAEERWVNCYVTYAGPGWGGIFITLTDASDPKSFTAKWFIPQPGQQREMLATALAAVANGNMVRCYVDPDVEYSYIKAMYIAK
jgi:hypothetical protein